MLQKGLTLIELLITIAILLILTAGSAPLLSRFYLQNAVLQTDAQFKSAIRKAQIYSMTGKRGTAWGVLYGSNTLTLFSGNTYATRNTAFDENYTVNSNIAVSGITEIDFTRVTGLPNATPTITLNASSINQSRTINVNSQGLATGN